MANERLMDFPAKPIPVAADIVYVGDSADSFNEVQSTIGEIFAGYSAALASLAALSSSANQMPYYSGVNTFAVTSLTAFARTLLDDANAATAAATLAVLPLAGGTMLGTLILDADPIDSLDAATKQYVDNAVGSQSPARLASTGALTVTYANGTAGVGATLTNAGAQAALTLDGVAAIAGDRVLIKDQASTFQNGIYSVTDIGSGATNWVLTRALDFDTAANMIAGDFVTVGLGTANAKTQWILTASVAVVGTDAVVFESNVVAGSNITKTNNSIAVTSGVFLPLAGGTMAGILNMNSNSITNLPSPSAAGDATSKSYVDNLVLNVHIACLAASTTALTVTYDNGTSGVGATLTNAGAMAAFSVDGVSPAVNDRILIKNQASALQNGVYVVTTVGSGAANWVLTRASDYDQAADMQAGDKFAVVSGTTQAATEWMMTQTAAITVGTTAITFAEMGQVTAAVTSVVTQVFTGNGTYTPTSGMIYCTVEIMGGGAGGGGVANAAGASYRAAGGGGSGGYCRKTYTAAQIGATAAVVVGALGAGGANTGANGSAGGNSTFTPAGGGATLTANGGTGGTYDIIDRSTLGWGGGQSYGGGGSASGGDVNINGNNGYLSIIVGLTDSSNGFNGRGGSSLFGYGGRENVDGTEDGRSGIGYGAGGSGALSINAGGAGTGGSGTAGICIVTEFVSASA